MERRWRRWGARLSALCTYVHKQFPAFSPSPSHEDEVLKAAHNSAAAPHIHVGAASYSVTPHHFAFEHLRDMRGHRGLGARVIDEDGNFVSSKDEAKGGVGTNTSRASSVIAPAAISGYDLFEPQWEQEFLQSEYLHGYRVFSRWLTCACFLGSQASISWFTAPLGTMPEHCPLNSPFRQGVYGRLSVGMPNFLLQLLCSLIIRLSIPYIPRPQRVRLYPTLVVLWCLVLHGSYIHVGAVRELIRGLRGPAVDDGNKCSAIKHVTVQLDYSSSWIPTRICIDNNITQTITAWPFIINSGCESLLPDVCLPRAIEFMFVFYFMRCTWRTTLTFSVLSTTTLMLSCIAVGGLRASLAYPLTLHLLCGAVASYLCCLRTQQARQKFAKVKNVRITAEHSRKLLYTLVPPNVLARLASHSHDMGILATDIAHCTIMFCSLTERAGTNVVGRRRRSLGHVSDDVAEFQRLHAVYFDFDAAVQNTSLYKYQHVGPWYIITCPNAAEPFDLGAQHISPQSPHKSQRSQRSYATEMALLAKQFVHVAQRHGMDLRVGIHTGSAAGAVLGKLRAFYCIYGETVNTASRLCKYADRCQIHCSTAFVRLLEEEHSSACRNAGAGDAPSEIRVQPRGHVLLKGFAESMETFVVSEDEEGQSLLRAGAGQRMLPASETSFNVDAFTGAQALAASATATKERRAGEEGVKDDHLVTLLPYDDLSAESRAIAQLQDHKLNSNIINNNNNNNNLASDRFLDASIELQYKEQASLLLQYQTVAGVVWHLMGVIYQLFQVLYAGHQYDAEVLGHDLAAAYNTVHQLLHYHLAIQSIVGATLALSLWRVPLKCGEKMRMLLAVMRVAWLCVSICASRIWPQKHYTVCFAMLFAMSQTFIVFGSFQNMVILYVIVNLLITLALWSNEEFVNGAFVSRWVSSLIASWLFLVWSEDGHRRSWRLHHVFVTEMNRLDLILNDLLPLNLDGKSLFPGTAAVLSSAGVAEKNFWAQRRNSLNLLSGINTAHQREALVLQLDLCDFTQISSNTTPMQLAHALHEMFSAFDTTVQRLNLFKVDTVGDAFIVAAWLPHRDHTLLDPRAWGNMRHTVTLLDVEREKKSKALETQLCTKMFWLASSMLEAVNNARCGSQRFTARIGIGAGKVVVGALGSLQPRMHIRGDGAKEAERLEASGTPGCVHVCHSVLDLMSSESTADESVDDIGLEVARHASNRGGGLDTGASSGVRRRTGSLVETNPQDTPGGMGRRASGITHMSSIDVSLGGTWSHHRTGSASDAGDDVEGGSAQKQQELLLEQQKRRQAEKERLKKDKGILKDKVLRLLALASLNEWRVVEVKLEQGAEAPHRKASFVLDSALQSHVGNIRE